MTLRDPGIAFWKKVDRQSDGQCWNWRASKNAEGYGKIVFDGRLSLAHRVSYECLVAPIPRGLVLDHLCRNRGCVNPIHLEAVSNRENLLRGKTLPAANVLKIHCPQGHPYSPENTYINPAGARVCRSCCRLRAANRRAIAAKRRAI